MAMLLPPALSPASATNLQFSMMKISQQCILLPFPITAFFLLLLLPEISATDAGALYSAHCGDILRDQPLLPDPNPPILSPNFLSLRHAHVNFNSNLTNTGRGRSSVNAIPSSLSFSTRRAFRTRKKSIFKIEAVLKVIGVEFSHRRGLRLVHFRPPRIPVSSDGAWSSQRFLLSGFWDSTSGKLCMVGSGLGRLSSNSVVLKLDYLNSSSIFNTFVNGTLESLDVNNGSGFNPKLISILGVNLKNYKYELIEKEIGSNGFLLLGDTRKISLGVEDLRQDLCTYIRSAGRVELEYTSDCNSVNCNFLRGGNSNFTPGEMYLNEIECRPDGMVRFLLGFGNFGLNGYHLPFQPNLTLVSEGKWDAIEKRLNMVGCRIFSDWDDGFVGECLIRLSFRFPALWTLRTRSAVVGELWSSRRFNESGYFGKVILSSVKNNNVRATNLRYDYTEIKNAKSHCANKTKKVKVEKYPDALSSDMRFDMIVENRKSKDMWGYASPLYVNNRHYQFPTGFRSEVESTIVGKQNHSDAVNVSYVLQISTSLDFKLSSEYMHVKSFEVSAEGIYDPKSGHLCMIGCLHVESPRVKLGINSSLDCEILVDIWYPPLNSRNGGTVKGTIESRREKSHHLYFEPFKISSRSIYAEQAKESIWRIDLETTMVLISNTLFCIFMGLQLLHVKRHPDMLPLISIIMLIVLALAHMIPLLLNFEALFRGNRNNLNVYFGNDGWLEVNEVLVRVITMIAFLLELRLLQLTWSARSGDGEQKNLWISEKKVLYLSLPIYIGGGLIAWLVHQSMSHQRPSSRIQYLRYKQQSLWGDLKSYAGLILDGFLLPQILFNLLCDAKEKVLAPSFFIGTTFVRLMPHAYDLYRSHSSTWSFNIYANPKMDYYSTAWDIIISVVGLLFVFLIYMQQQYGGGCLLPNRFRQRSTYEKVPIVGNEAL